MRSHIQKKNSIQNISLWAGSIFLLVQPYLVHAQLKDRLQQSLTDLRGGQEGDIGVIVGKIIEASFGILGLVFLIIVVYAGFLWATSAGDPKKTKEARGMLINGIIGLAIAFSAYSITRFVVDGIGKATR